MTAADLEAVFDLRQSWLSRTLGDYSVSAKERKWFGAYPDNPQAFALLATENEQCVGYLLCSWQAHPTMSGMSANIDEVHVAFDFQRQGIGRRLVETARELLLERVADLTTLRASVDRKDVSGRAFWKSLGYEQDMVEFVDYLA
jgi:ribosomal protein S18 acetylase RimI-like enzyme